jgi:hypothetical protein
MPLPTSRNRTYAPGSQVFSEDLNDIQDVIVDAHVNGARGDRTDHIPATSGHGTSITPGEEGVTFPSVVNAWQIDLRLETGQRLKSVSALVDPAGASAMTMQVRKRSAAGVNTQVGASATSTGAALQTISIAGMAEVVGSAHDHYYVRISPGQTSDQVFSLLVTTDVP